jgi:hypothetical protein
MAILLSFSITVQRHAQQNNTETAYLFCSSCSTSLLDLGWESWQKRTCSSGASRKDLANERSSRDHQPSRDAGQPTAWPSRQMATRPPRPRCAKRATPTYRPKEAPANGTRKSRQRELDLTEQPTQSAQLKIDALRIAVCAVAPTRRASEQGNLPTRTPLDSLIRLLNACSCGTAACHEAERGDRLDGRTGSGPARIQHPAPNRRARLTGTGRAESPPSSGSL